PDPHVDESHAALDVQGGLDAGQRQTELDQRDRHRRPHADDDRFGIEDTRDGGDIIEHSADEAVDDFQRGNIDQHALGVGFDDLAGQVLFERCREPVMHVDLNGHKQRTPELQDWNAIHDYWL